MDAAVATTPAFRRVPSLSLARLFSAVAALALVASCADPVVIPARRKDGEGLADAAPTPQPQPDAGPTRADAAPAPIPVGPPTVALSTEPSPAIVGTNSLRLDITWADGAPVAGAEVAVDLWMPAHGHGAPPPRVVETEPGVYTSSSLVLTMDGTWEFTVDVTAAGKTESTLLNVEVRQ